MSDESKLLAQSSLLGEAAACLSRFLEDKPPLPDGFLSHFKSCECKWCKAEKLLVRIAAVLGKG